MEVEDQRWRLNVERATKTSMKAKHHLDNEGGKKKNPVDGLQGKGLAGEALGETLLDLRRWLNKTVFVPVPSAQPLNDKQAFSM